MSEEFRGWLKAIRGARALSRKGLARDAMVDQATVSRVEAGISEPTDDYLRKIARPLGLDPAYLVARAAADRLGAQGVAYLRADGAHSAETVAFIATAINPETPPPSPVTGSNHGPAMVSRFNLPAFKPTAEGIPPLAVELGVGLLPLYVATGGEPFMWTAEEPSGVVVVSARMAAKADAGFRVTGNSVSARGILDGTIVIVKKLPDGERPPSGKLVVIETGGAFMVKVYRTGPGGEYVESDEAGQDPVTVEFSEDVRLVGRVVGIELEVD